MTTTTATNTSEIMRQCEEDAAAFLRVLHAPGEIIEVRVLRAHGKEKRIDSGYFDTHDKAAAAAIKADVITTPRGVYVTFNPVRPELLARAANRLKVWSVKTTSDANITSRRWLFLDLDPVREDDISASDAEHTAAQKRAEDVRDWLMNDYEFHAPVELDSGNGAYLLFPIDLANDGDALQLVKRVLAAISDRWSDEAVKVDTAVCNASRIIRLPGTTNRKGDSTGDRQHRRCEMIAVPDYLERGWRDPVPRKKLEAVAALVDQRAATGATAATHSKSSTPGAGGADVLTRARKYLEEIPGGVSGEKGSNPTFAAAAALVRGFDLSDNDALTLLTEWNATCKPPWSDRELQHKIKSARAKAEGEPGYLLKSTRAAERPRLAAGTPVRPTDRKNFGTVIQDSGATISVHFVSPEGESADVEFAPGELRHADGRPVDPTAVPRVEIVSVAQLIESHPRLRPAVVDGVLRRGEVCNVIAKSKVGKSWLTYSLALNVAVGRNWFDKFATAPGRVLLIDNELHPETLANRIPTVAAAMGLQPGDYRDRLDVMSLRGQLMPIGDLAASLESVERDQYSLIVLDALYRMLPDGMGENDNAAMAMVYNTVDRYAAQTGAAFVLIHHASKGDQSGKDVTDVGSGASSQARAADAHLILRPHEEDDCVVLEAAVRSWPRPDPLALRWSFPVWAADPNLDPAAIRRAPSKLDAQQEAKDRDGCGKIVEALREHGPGTESKIRDLTGFSKDRACRLIAQMRRDGRLVSEEITIRGNLCLQYKLADYL